MGKWTDKDTSRETGDSTSKVSHAEHVARDDATKEGLFSRGDREKNSQRLSRTDDSGQRAEGFWSSIFGSKKD